MSPLINVTIHSSQFPEKVQADLLNSLRLRQINHKFHYDSYKQTRKWLELHQAYSPSRTDPNCSDCYDAAFAVAATHVLGVPSGVSPDVEGGILPPGSRPQIRQRGSTSTSFPPGKMPGSTAGETPAATTLKTSAAKIAGNAPVHLIGLGCGGGQKDARVLRLLKQNHAQLLYTPVDVSTPMVLVAHQAASEIVSESHPLVCDLSSADDLTAVFAGQTPPNAVRLITFFGMMPNFEPHLVLPKLAALLRSGDMLLLSANLAPGKDYAAGLRQILPLYDNALTTDWLLTFLLDMGVEQTDGVLEWSIEPCPTGQDLLRLTAWFHFRRLRSLRVAGEDFRFAAGEKIRLFFSYRHTPERLRDRLSQHGLAVRDQWITESGEEGVFLCDRRS